MSHKATPIFFEGEKIIRLSDLNAHQSEPFSQWVSTSSYIVLGEKNDFDCVKYEDYEYWYHHYFMTEKDLDYYF